MVECNECGGKLKKGDLFCSQCGAKISVMKPDSKAAKSRKAKPKAAKPGALKKEPVELTDEVKRRLKAELEISIKAFKRGDITLEEFQDIKKSIVTKARAGFYDVPSEHVRSVHEPAPPQFEPEAEPFVPAYSIPEPPMRRTPDHGPTGELYKPMRRLDEPLFSKLWYLVPIVFNLIGGLIAYFAVKPSDEKSAKKMLAIGVLSFILVAGVAGYYAYNEGLLGQKDVLPPPTEIVIEGVEAEVVEVLPLNISNASAAEMNLVLGDFEGGFTANNILSGTLKDPLEFAGGDTVFAENLSVQGWLENHRVLFTKDFTSAENTTLMEWEIDSSISKYNVSRASKTYFDTRLGEFENTFSQGNYSLIDFDVGEKGFMAKKVESDSEFGLKVSYRVFFYEKDAFVSLSVSKVGRGLEEEEVVGYARIIEQRIK